MALNAVCSCGKSLSVSEAYGGKRVKCPQCGQAVTIPAASVSSASGSEREQRAESAISIRCRCGKVLSVRSELAGKAVKCPACGQAVRIPTPAAGKRDPVAESTSIAATRSIADLLDEFDLTESKTGFRCPECRTDLEPGVILCVHCGYRLDKGKKMVTRRVGDQTSRPK